MKVVETTCCQEKKKANKISFPVLAIFPRSSNVYLIMKALGPNNAIKLVNHNTSKHIADGKVTTLIDWKTDSVPYSGSLCLENDDNLKKADCW